MNDLISIIVPIYNVEKYLEKCIRSLINQSYKKIEIILVNDGSKDRSGEICDTFAIQDHRIVVIHKRNGGLSSARNAGLNIMNGKYVSFIDGDDFVDYDFISSLYSACEIFNSEIAICGRYMEFEDGKTKKFNCFEENKIWNTKEVIHNLLLWKGVDSSVCDKIFVSKLFKDIRFPDGHLHEDIPVTYKILLHQKIVVHIGAAKYHYLQRINGITRTNFSDKKIDLYSYSCKLKNDVDSIFPDLEIESSFFLMRNICTILMTFNNQKIINMNLNSYNMLHEKYSDLYRRKEVKKLIKSKYEKIKLGMCYCKKEISFNTIKYIINSFREKVGTKS